MHKNYIVIFPISPLINLSVRSQMIITRDKHFMGIPFLPFTIFHVVIYF
jgi:hypothetical protein